MRVIRWKNSATGVESLNITATGIYFPVGKTDSSFKLKLSMASAGQTTGVDTVRDSSGSRTGYGAMNVSGITETKLGAVVSLATGIIVTAISGTLNAILDDEIAITSWPEVSLGRFPAIEDLVAYCYGSNPPVGLLASVNGTQYTYRAGGWEADVLTTYATYAELPASGATEAYLTNAWAPLGKTRMIKATTGWQPAFGEILAFERGLDGGTLIDVIATALTVGSLNQIYQSDVLPDWIFSQKFTLRISAEGGLRGGSSVNSFVLIAGVSDAAFASNNAPLGVALAAVAATYRGFIQPFARLRQVAGQVIGSVASVTNQTESVIGTYSKEATRFRLSVNPGHITNQIQLRSWSITMGDC